MSVLQRKHDVILKGIAAAIASLTLLAGSANAADLPMRMREPLAPPPAIFCWTGGYLGIATGYAWGKDTLTEYFTGTNTFTGFNPSYGLRSPLVGLYAGYNYQFGSAVLGAETDLEAASLRGGFLDPVLGGAGTTQLDWQGSARGRLGYAVDKMLFYGTGGLAYASVSHTYTNLFTGVAETTSGIRTGWTAGAGVEIALTTNLLARAEYRYTSYGPYRYDSVTSFPGLSGTQAPRFGAVRLGAAYKF